MHGLVIIEFVGDNVAQAGFDAGQKAAGIDPPAVFKAHQANILGRAFGAGIGAAGDAHLEFIGQFKAMVFAVQRQTHFDRVLLPDAAEISAGQIFTDRTHRPMAAPGIMPSSCQIWSRSVSCTPTRAIRWADVSLMALTLYFSATSARRRSISKSVMMPPGIWGAMANETLSLCRMAPFSRISSATSVLLEVNWAFSYQLLPKTWVRPIMRKIEG